MHLRADAVTDILTDDGAAVTLHITLDRCGNIIQPAAFLGELDATTVLSRKIVEQGIYPAVDPLESTSRILEPDIVGEEHYQVARKVQEIHQSGLCLEEYVENLR